MKVLVIGGGGREHAICWALRRSARVKALVCAPGNAGIAALATCVPVHQESAADVLRVARQTAPDLVVIGPEVPLAAGAVDALQAAGFRVFGPTRAAARLESSKSFAKAFMTRHGIPTARSVTVRSAEDLGPALKQFAAPVVVKADGLAAGKGVTIAETLAEAEAAASAMLQTGPGSTVVLEEFLEGEELSFFALCDGTTAVPIAAAQDHKRLLEGDRGPNTGGMGAYSTGDLMDVELCRWLMENVAQKTVDGMRSEGAPFQGILFCGIMRTPDGPMVLEFNTRWGDPETQAILLRLESDLADLLEASVDGTAAALQVRLRPGASVCIVAASPGYPASPLTGAPIHGLEKSPTADVQIFHSGTARRGAEIVTAGGRVLGVTAVADNLRRALGKAYDAMGEISFEGMQVRRDIGHRALAKGGRSS